MKYSRLIASATFPFFIAVAVFSQDQKIAAGDLVFLNATVLTSKDELVTGLRADNFKIYEQNLLVPITSFTSGKAPMTVGILIDRSKSTKEVVMPTVRKSIKKFINDNGGNNEYFLMSFGKMPEILSEVTDDQSKIVGALESISDIANSKETRFFDAVAAAVQRASTGHFPRKVLIILSDGQDNGSKNGLESVRTAAEKYGVTLYFMDLAATDTKLLGSGTPSSAQSNGSGLISMSGSSMSPARSIAPRSTMLSPAAEDMQALADASGGVLFPLFTDDDLDMALSVLSKELQSQYQFGFSLPAGQVNGKDLKRHNFSIKLDSLTTEVEKQEPRIRARSKMLF